MPRGVSNEKKATVYAIVCSANNWRYIGSTSKSWKVRWRAHLSVLRKGIHPNRVLQADFDRYGESEFFVETLERCLHRDRYTVEATHLVLAEKANPGLIYNRLTLKTTIARALRKGFHDRASSPSSSSWCRKVG